MPALAHSTFYIELCLAHFQHITHLNPSPSPPPPPLTLTLYRYGRQVQHHQTPRDDTSQLDKTWNHILNVSTREDSPFDSNGNCR